MNKGIGLFVGLTALFAMGSAQAACPGTQVLVYSDINDATGHVFEVYKANGISWNDAADCANDTNVTGATGHLATITSSSENQWVIDQLLAPSLAAATPLQQSQVWVGGVQDASATGVGDGWRWVNSEGPFSGTNNNLAMPGYTNWAGSEPNDGDGVENGKENYLTVGRYPGNFYVWNDEGAAPGSIGGFIVEYDVPRAAECTVGVDCQTIDGQTLVFPDGSFQTGATIKFTAYEFTDPRVGLDGKCTVNPGPLTLFTDAAFGAYAQLRIPAYLCGSPKFVVVAVDSSQLEILKGTVFVEHETTEKVLPNNLYRCFDPILGNLAVDTPYAPDPQYQDVVVWQSTDPTKMLEDSVGAGIYDGAATEATNGCGSTVAKVRGASYFVVGMHIDFGNAAYDYANSPALNYQQFVALTEYKLSLLQTAVANAKADGALKNGDATKMTAQLNNAVKKLGQGNPSGALGHVNQFLKFVNAANYTVIPDQNYNGDHLMRGENIAFTLRVKVIPYKQP